MGIKKCSVCGSTTNEFAIRYDRGHRTIRGTCKICQGARNRKNLARPEYRQRYNIRRRERRLEKAEFMYNYLASHPCVECGEADPLVLQFHHLRDKLFGIGAEIREKSLESIKQEIQKCVVCCGNCHMRKTRQNGKIWTSSYSNRPWLNKKRQFIYDYLNQHRCVDCGNRDSIVLEFDHVRGTKSFNISSKCLDKPLVLIESEIAKCDIRCTNCHLRRTIITSDNNEWFKVMKVKGIV